MQENQIDPTKKKKKRPTLLSEKMGLDQGSDYEAPPAAKPGLFPGTAAMALDDEQSGPTTERVEAKLKSRGGIQRGR
jgi:hypothetical protein